MKMQPFWNGRQTYKILILCLLMGTYYLAQLLLAKGAFFVAVHFTSQKELSTMSANEVIR